MIVRTLPRRCAGTLSQRMLQLTAVPDASRKLSWQVREAFKTRREPHANKQVLCTRLQLSEGWMRTRDLTVISRHDRKAEHAMIKSNPSQIAFPRE